MFNNYTLNDVSQIETPEFLIFESKVESNIDSIISLVGDKKRLVPHAKTHKSKQILNKCSFAPDSDIFNEASRKLTFSSKNKDINFGIIFSRIRFWVIEIL